MSKDRRACNRRWIDRTGRWRGASDPVPSAVAVAVRAALTVHEDLLASSSDGVDAHLAVESLDLLAGSAADTCGAAHDLRGLSRAQVVRLRGVHLGEGNHPREVLVRHARFELVRDLLEHRVAALHAASHLRHLVAQNLVVHLDGAGRAAVTEGKSAQAQHNAAAQFNNMTARREEL